MEIKLLKEDDPFLRQIALPWDFIVDGNPNALIKNMAKVMIENNGIGLAAPQVGVNKRVFVMGNETKLFACINPEIISSEGSEMDTEGCLSFPKLWLRVRRPNKINVKYYNAMGELVETEFAGILSRVFQHERDHLDGICFDTKVAQLSLQLAKNRRKKNKNK